MFSSVQFSSDQSEPTLALQHLVNEIGRRLFEQAGARETKSPVVDLVGVSLENGLLLGDDIEVLHDFLGDARVDAIANAFLGSALGRLFGVDSHRVELELASARIERAHQVPGVGFLVAEPVAAVAEVGANGDAGNIEELGEHLLDHGARIELGAVEVEDSKVARHHKTQVRIADAGGAVSGQFDVLGQDALVAILRHRLDVRRQNLVADESLVVEETAGKVNRQSFRRGGSEDGSSCG